VGGVALWLRAQQLKLGTLSGANEDQSSRYSNYCFRAHGSAFTSNLYKCRAEASVELMPLKTVLVIFVLTQQMTPTVDMIEMGILDPTKVVRSALQFAAFNCQLDDHSECMITDAHKR